MLLVVDEVGMSTVEYAIGTIAAAAFGAILYTVVTGDSIVERADEHHHPGAEHQRLTGDRGACHRRGGVRHRRAGGGSGVVRRGSRGDVDAGAVCRRREGGGPAGGARRRHGAARTGRDIAPVDAGLDIRRDGGLVVATVTARSILLPGIDITREAVAAVEPTA